MTTTSTTSTTSTGTRQRLQAAREDLFNATCALHDAHTAHVPAWVDAAIAHIRRADDAYTTALAAVTDMANPDVEIRCCRHCDGGLEQQPTEKGGAR